MKNRDRLYKEAISLIETRDPQKESILYHNIHSLKMSGNYLFPGRKEVMELVNLLNTY